MPATAPPYHAATRDAAMNSMKGSSSPSNGVSQYRMQKATRMHNKAPAYRRQAGISAFAPEAAWSNEVSVVDPEGFGTSFNVISPTIPHPHFGCCYPK